MLDIEARMAVTNDVFKSGGGNASFEYKLTIDSLRLTDTDANDREVVTTAKFDRERIPLEMVPMESVTAPHARSASLRGRTVA
jgi:hypothetical protein